MTSETRRRARSASPICFGRYDRPTPWLPGLGLVEANGAPQARRAPLLAALALAAGGVLGCGGEVVDRGLAGRDSGGIAATKLDSGLPRLPLDGGSSLGSDRGPTGEACNQLDDDQDGQVDENCPCNPALNAGQQDCYTASVATRGRGTCRAGIQRCLGDQEFKTWGVCSGEVTPQAEVPGDRLDNDCDGEVDENTLPPACSNGATNYPTCTIDAAGNCINGMTHPPACTTPPPCQTAACYRYEWSIGAFGRCSADCGGGTQTRSVACVRSDDGVVVTDSLCAGTRPEGSQGCNSSPCVTYSWRIGEWGACSAPVPCGASRQTRSVSCVRSDGAQVDDSFCSGSKPQTEQSCPATSCTQGQWSLGEFGACELLCSTSAHRRFVGCIRSDGVSVADTFCAGTKPTDRRSCTYQNQPSPGGDVLVLDERNLSPTLNYVLGGGGGGDVYVISTQYASRGHFTISDLNGVNVIQFVHGLSLTEFALASHTLVVTLSNGLELTVASADTFRYSVGGRPGFASTSLSFAQFVTTFLGASVPTNAGAVVRGGPRTLDGAACVEL